MCNLIFLCSINRYLAPLVTLMKLSLGKALRLVKSSTMEPLIHLFFNLRYFKFGFCELSPTMIRVAQLVKKGTKYGIK